MQISHEIPLCLLEDSRTFNDYDYCLVHLLDQHPEYKEFYIRSIKERNRKVILDNSVFELGKSFDSYEYVHKILEIKPTAFVVPDVLEDMARTILSYEQFVDNYRMSSQHIGVVQGKTRDELIECYKFMSDKADIIAISFDYSYYRTLGESLDDDVQLNERDRKHMFGRIAFISDLLANGIINKDKPHHLLGCALPQELSFYNPSYHKFIQSIDTSSPIMAGINGVRYNKGGLTRKPEGKLAEHIQRVLTPEQLEITKENIRQFKSNLRRWS